MCWLPSFASLYGKHVRMESWRIHNIHWFSLQIQQQQLWQWQNLGCTITQKLQSLSHTHNPLSLAPAPLPPPPPPFPPPSQPPTPSAFHPPLQQQQHQQHQRLWWDLGGGRPCRQEEKLQPVPHQSLVVEVVPGEEAAADEATAHRRMQLLRGEVLTDEDDLV